MKREDYKEIGILIEKYFNAETSLEEESRIKDYYRTTPHAEIPEAIRSSKFAHANPFPTTLFLIHI